MDIFLYSIKHNLKFSTDPLPHKSKSKCIYFCGKMTRLTKPDPLTLLGEELPWVANADHLGHVLDQSCTMDKDSAVKRARFIDKTVGLRESFYFAYPEQVIRAVQVYACDAYGAMLYDFTSASCESLLKSWNTCIKLIWNVPRSTFTYLVDHVLGDTFVSLRKQVYGRFAGFFQNLFRSSSREIRHLARIVSRDARTVTFKNIQHLTGLSGYSPWDYSASKIRQHLPVTEVPAGDWWRPSFLRKLLTMRSRGEGGPLMNKMIDSLCST